MSTVNLSEALIERAKAVTGLTRRDDAVRAAIELAEASVKLKAKRKPAAKAVGSVTAEPTITYAQLIRDERKPGGKRFADPDAAKQFLRSVW